MCCFGLADVLQQVQFVLLPSEAFVGIHHCHLWLVWHDCDLFGKSAVQQAQVFEVQVCCVIVGPRIEVFCKRALLFVLVGCFG